MNDNKHIIECYDKTAKAYADKYIDELTQKHLDRILLNAFAAENHQKGKFIDLGCGPGQTTKFLFECGISKIVGTDISPVMIQTAKEIHPQLQFEVADMLALQYANEEFSAAVAFYAIVHFNIEQLVKAIQEIRRILKKNGEFLFSFHVGDQVVHLDEFLEQPVQIDFHFFEMNNVIGLLTGNGFEIIDAIERQPYTDTEYPSKRAYLWARAC